MAKFGLLNLACSCRIVKLILFLCFTIEIVFSWWRVILQSQVWVMFQVLTVYVDLYFAASSSMAVGVVETLQRTSVTKPEVPDVAPEIEIKRDIVTPHIDNITAGSHTNDSGMP